MAEFEQWATQQGYTLRPAFDWRSTDSAGDGKSQRREIVTPLITLAVYTEGEDDLQAVYPHVDGEDVRTIHDGVEMLESMAGDTKQSGDEQREQVTVPAE
nr:HTH domain-containing protein [Halalkalicoccus paucihalophilus]